MKIELKEIAIKDIFEGYSNSEFDEDADVDGVVGYNGLLNIRPAYQREFVYKDAQRDEVIVTIRKNFPLNVMYWSKNADGSFELLDGQQRTISIIEYLTPARFSINHVYFSSLTKEEQEQILNYKLMIYICEGTEREKLDWFKTINIAGEKLLEQELRNAIYTGEWLVDAKKHFSKRECPAGHIAKKYLKGSAIRQEYLETALKWISDRDGIEIEEYMAIHQKDKDAQELWVYFQVVINWVKTFFIDYKKEMQGIHWGLLYNKYKNNIYNPNDLKDKINALYLDDDVTNKKGIFEYVLSNDEKYLNIRAFPESIRNKVYLKQKGICPICEHTYEIEEMEADHITPWSLGGKTIEDNCQMLCKDCNRRKSNK